MHAPTRLVSPDDAAGVAELLRRNRELFAPYEPVRPDEYYTTAGQAAVITEALGEHEHGRCLPHVVLDDLGEPVGRITLTNVVRGAFQSCHVGYWVSRSHQRRGLATAAVGEMVRIAFTELGLHRVQADTLTDNIASQTVLARNGFVRIGLAPDYLRIAGRWQDHVLHQVVDPSAR